MSDMFDWRQTTYDGARREQLRRWATLPLEEIIKALEEMQDLTNQLRGSVMNHITLNTGHTRDSPRSEVSDDILKIVAALLTRALTGANRCRSRGRQKFVPSEHHPRSRRCSSRSMPKAANVCRSLRWASVRRNEKATCSGGCFTSRQLARR